MSCLALSALCWTDLHRHPVFVDILLLPTSYWGRTACPFGLLIDQRKDNFKLTGHFEGVKMVLFKPRCRPDNDAGVLESISTARIGFVGLLPFYVEMQLEDEVQSRFSYVTAL